MRVGKGLVFVCLRVSCGAPHRPPALDPPKKAQPLQEGSRCNGIQGGTSKEEIKCVCLNARSIINKKNELNIMVDDI